MIQNTPSRRLARLLMGKAAGLLPAPRRHWADAMRNEFEYVEDDEALGWAAGCLYTSTMEQLKSFHLPDGPVVRLLLALPLALLIFSDISATALTAAYRTGALSIAQRLGHLTPGDDYRRLIPLMENVPLWLHALWTTAAVLYAVTVILLAAKRKVSCIPVVLAIVLEIAARIAERPVIASIGVSANPNPSALAVIIPLILPIALALYLWKMEPAHQNLTREPSAS